MIQQLYTHLKRLEDSLYRQINRDSRVGVRRLCGTIFAETEQLLQSYEFSPAQRSVLEGIRTSADTIDDTVDGDFFDRMKANDWLVRPYLHKLEHMARVLDVRLPPVRNL